MENTIALSKVKTFFQKNHRLPSYTEMLALFGVKSRNAVFERVQRWIKQGQLAQDGRKLSPGTKFFELPVLGSIKAGLPTEAGVYDGETYSLTHLMAGNLGALYLLHVSGDSMINEGIRPGDLVILDKHRAAKQGDIVAALIDYDWTLKYFNKGKEGVFLTAANPKYPPLHPKDSLVIGGVVTKVVREYY
ncbi:MAG: LexA family protein [Candidatus Margulisiibacteriota bacterium]